MLDSKGYAIILKKQYQSKDVFINSKNSIETELEVSANMQKPKTKTIVENFEQRFLDLITLQQLKKRIGTIRNN